MNKAEKVTFYGTVINTEFYFNGERDKFTISFQTVDGVKVVKGYTPFLDKFKTSDGVAYKEILDKNNVFLIDAEFCIKNVTEYLDKDGNIGIHKDTGLYLTNLTLVSDDDADFIRAASNAAIMGFEGKDKVMFTLAYMGKTTINY